MNDLKTEQVRIQEQARQLCTKVLDLFVQTLREYTVFKLKASKFVFLVILLEYGEQFVSAAQNRGPPDLMRTETNKGPILIKIGDNPDVWDLQVLISIFHDHHDSLFGKTSD